MPVMLSDVRAAFVEWMAGASERPDRVHQIDIALSTTVGNRMDGDPLWVFIIAPPSGGKTEVVRALDDVPDVYPLSSLTPLTFASGFERKGVETSLLPNSTARSS
jgi:hypothetical protein